MSDDYSSYVSFSDDKEPDQGMSLLDPVKNIGAETANTAATAATAGQYAAERRGGPGGTPGLRADPLDLHELGDWAESGITEAGKQARDAALIPSEGQEQLGSHPLREFAMKLSGAAPAIGAIGVGSLAGGVPGAAAAGAGFQYAQDLDRAISWTNKASDEELAKAAPIFDQKKLELYQQNLKDGLGEAEAEQKASQEARAFLHRGLYTGGEALVSGLVGAATGVMGEGLLKGKPLGEGLANYVLTGDPARATLSTAIPLTTKQAIGKNAIEGAVSAIPLGAASATSDYIQQQGENFAQGKEGVDPGRSLVAFLNGTALG